MKSFLTSLFLLLTIICNAQNFEVGLSPNSFTGWGQLPQTPKLNLSLFFDAYQYQDIKYQPGIRYSYINSTSTTVDDLGDRVDGMFSMIFILPVGFDIPLGKVSVIGRTGIGISTHLFPNDNGVQTNFLLETGLGYPFNDYIRFSVRYSHISNGGRGIINPGLDNIVLVTEFYL